MSELMNHSHIRIMRSASLGVTHTEVEITTNDAGDLATAAVSETRLLSLNEHPHGHGSRQTHNGNEHDGHGHDDAECFDPACCDAGEKALIRSLRAYLRPQIAPDCLITRLNQVLDRYCEVDLPNELKDRE